MGVHGAVPLEDHSRFSVLKIQRCATELLLFKDRAQSIMRIDDVLEVGFC